MTDRTKDPTASSTEAPDAKPTKEKSLNSSPQLKAWEGSSAFVEQGRHWSSALIWLTSGLFATALIWAFVAKVDQTISVVGRLEPAGSVKEVDSPSAGLVSKVFVKEGQSVKQGQPLLDVEAKGLASRRKAIEKSISLFELQARSLQVIISSNGDPENIGALPPIPVVEDPKLVAQLTTARNQTQQLVSRLSQIQTQLLSRQESLRLQEFIASDLEDLYAAGGIARNSYLREKNRVQEQRSQVASLAEEKSRLVGESATQLNQINQRLINLRSELVGLDESIGYRTVRAPISGTVFNLKAGPFSVVGTDQVLLKIVPADRLQAKVKINNSDIGFVRSGMPVSVAVDSFSAGEFGYIKGTLESIGSDVLPPQQPGGQDSFPAIIRLNQQEVLSGDQNLNLQSGMSVRANIKLRSRPAISILTDMFTRQQEGIKRFR